MLANPGSTERTRVRRIPELAVTDRSTLHQVLDAGLLGHLALADDDRSAVRATGGVRARRRVACSCTARPASRLFRLCAAGTPVCFTVTLLDGLVLARSAFESSMNYRSVMVLGHCNVLHGKSKELGLRLITEHLMPERWDEIRKPSAQELKCDRGARTPPRRVLGEDQRRRPGRRRGRRRAAGVGRSNTAGPAVGRPRGRRRPQARARPDT